MPAHATPDPSSTALAFGQRMQILRTKRGLSRPVLAGLVGRSPSWVKQVEGGQIQTPALPIILRIAEVLRVRDLADLLGDQTPHQALFIGPGHARLPAVREAMNSLALSAGQAPPISHLHARIARAWAARHSAPNHRDVLGSLLPALIRDGRLAVRQADTAADRRTAQAALAEVYFLAQFFLSYQPDSALVWRVSERGMVAAQESEDPHSIGVAAWLAAQAHRDSGGAHLDAADTIVREALEYLSPRLDTADDRTRAISGALQFEAGYTAARRGEAGAAWGWWDQANRTAAALTPTYFHPVTSFSRAIMGAHAVTVAVELRSGHESVRQAAAADAAPIPSRPRLARHRIEEARAYQLDGQADTALATLEKAHRAAPETIRWSGYARRIILEEAESKSPARRRRAAGLAHELGLLAA
ncbi:helix-turn-helix domain-containing protein [Streptomyces sp. NRRL F-5630]|uniref:helix-turn-helix domain-containing protein n=1 Tax=Streptomyces sp. NRRL F-5630 TaxID=1463864 RepID=UPI003D75E29D